jgi:hypothetical protein
MVRVSHRRSWICRASATSRPGRHAHRRIAVQAPAHRAVGERMGGACGDDDHREHRDVDERRVARAVVPGVPAVGRDVRATVALERDAAAHAHPRSRRPSRRGRAGVVDAAARAAVGADPARRSRGGRRGGGARGLLLTPLHDGRRHARRGGRRSALGTAAGPEAARGRDRAVLGRRRRPQRRGFGRRAARAVAGASARCRRSTR